MAPSAPVGANADLCVHGEGIVPSSISRSVVSIVVISACSANQPERDHDCTYAVVLKRLRRWGKATILNPP